MWQKPWRWGEGVCVCVGLMLTGMVLQLTIGGVDWQQLGSPVNVIVALAYVIAICLSYALRKKIYFVRWTTSRYAAVSCLVAVVLLTFLMGVIRQTTGPIDGHNPIDILGLSRMLSFWPFVLVYIWMTTILGLVTVRQICAFSLAGLPVILNHLGLFVALVCATLGNADMQRLKMMVQEGQAEWRAIDDAGNLHELALAVELRDFILEEYPPKLLFIENATGKVVEEEPAEIKIDTLERLNFAAQVRDGDSVKYVAWQSAGATNALLIRVSSSGGDVVCQGWVSCGSYIFPYQALRLDDTYSIVMPDREPRRFASDVTIYTKSGKKINTTIEVNKPASVEGWKIYQLSYDETKGRWSDVSVFELVTDPWLPAVYIGIGLMVLGALSMFVCGSARRKNDSPTKEYM